MSEKTTHKKKKFSEWPLWMKVIVIVEIIIILLLLAVMGVLFSKVNKIEKIEVKEEVIEESITTEVEHKTGYLNVAVFGLDSRDGSLGQGNLSDTIMIASLNFETNEVKLVSIYRDTLMLLKDGTYNKANAAYSFYGPEGGIALINQNMDMNIEKYVTVNFNALVDVIDAVGGMDLELTDAEVVHMNNYCVETSKVTGKSYEKIEPEVAGTYHLNGVQAVSYSRIRYTAGGDVERTVRQRIVISKIIEKMQNMNLSTINAIVDNVFPQVATNFTLTEILSYAKDFKEYKLGDSMGFPNSRTSKRLYGVGWAEIAQTMASGVTEVHQFLFGDDGYQVSSMVQEIDQEIANRIASGVYDEPVKDVPEDTSNVESAEQPVESVDNNASENVDQPADDPADSTTPEFVFEEEYYYGD